MNKERSKMFAQRMKGVFKSKSHTPETIPIIPENLECESRLDSNKSSLLPHLYAKEINPSPIVANGCYSSRQIFTIPECLNTVCSKDKRESCADCADNSNARWLRRQIINRPKGECYTEGKQTNGYSLLHSNESTTDDINETQPFSNCGSNIYGLQRQFNLCRCDLPTCLQKCPRNGAVCTNNNVLATNNNYLLNSYAAKKDGSLFSSVLKYAFTEENSNRNDFTVLALGIHHYVKEVFNALDSNNKGYIPYEDVQILCRILGKEVRDLGNSVKCLGITAGNQNKSFLCGDNSCEIHLHFGKFSEIIYNIFGQEDKNCLENRKNTHLINAVVNITRRNESLNIISKQLEELEKEYIKLTTNKDYLTGNNTPHTVKDRGKPSSKDQINKNNHFHLNNEANICLENLKLQKIILLQQQELQCLREVIEDLRVSLQCSDAENLNLKVREEKKNNRISFSSSSDELTSRRSSSSSTTSTEDEKDSIDRLILSFPSTDQLIDIDSNDSLLSISSRRSSFDRETAKCKEVLKSTSNKTQTSSESLMSIESSQNRTLQGSSTPSTFSPNFNQSQESRTKLNQSSQPNIKVPSHKPIEDDLSLENELQMVYEKLSVTKVELEDTRRDLEISVAEIRSKNSILDHLKEKLTEAEKRGEDFSRENETLKEKNVFLQMEEENLKIKMESLVKEMAVIRAQLGSKNQEITEITQEFNQLKTKR